MSELINVKASLDTLRLAPRKVSLVAGLVRGRTVDDALVILSNTDKRAAKPLYKLIASARANAVNNHGLKSDSLRLTTMSVTAGTRIKRFRPVARGMAHPFQKKTSNVLVVVSGELKPAKKTKTEASAAVKEAKTAGKESK